MPADLITMADQVWFTLDYSWFAPAQFQPGAIREENLLLVLSLIFLLLKNQHLQIPIGPG